MTDEPLPTYDETAERSVLGAALISPAALDIIVDTLFVEEFYKPAHQEIFSAILKLNANGNPVDAVTLADQLRADGNLQRVGGAPFLHTLLAEVPTARNAAYYVDIVTRDALKRRAVTAGKKIQQLAYTWPADEPGLIDEIERLTAAVTVRERADGDLIDLDTAVTEGLERLAGPVPPTTPTGLPDLDDYLTGGLRKGAVYVVAARPGHGKSLAGAGIGLHVAQAGSGVLICSLEMSRDEITNRILANMSGVRLHDINTHNLSDLDWARLRKAREQFRGAPLVIRDAPHLTATSLRRLAERLTKKPHGLGLIIIDYVQQMVPADPKAPREQQVAELSRSSKRLAMQLQVPIILLAQTNRRSLDRPTPDAADLRESGSLEADADVVIILRVPDDVARAGELDAHIVKNRHGRLGAVTLSWSPHYARIRSFIREAS